MHQLLGYILLALIIIGVTAVLYIPLFFLLRKQVKPLRQVGFVLLAGSIFVILTATIFVNIRHGLHFHIPEHLLNINLTPFHWMVETYGMGFKKMMVQLVSNILLFVPFGFLLPVVFVCMRSMANTILVVFIFSLSIETFQFFIGRSADVDDLIMNVLGGTIGYVAFSLCRDYFK